MKYEEPKAARFSVEASPLGTTILIRAKRNYFALCFMVVWLCAWTYGGFFAMSEFLRTSNLFLVFWLIMWLLGWIAVATSLMWQLFGVQFLRADGQDLEVGYRLAGMTRAKRYRGNSIRGMSANANFDPNGSHEQAGSFFEARTGCVKFIYGERMVFAGADLDEREGQLIVERLRPALPPSATAAP